MRVDESFQQETCLNDFWFQAKIRQAQDNALKARTEADIKMQIATTKEK